MSKVPKRYVREIRDNLGRFPIWPLVDDAPLGSIGFFSGRKAVFSWKGSVSAFGINLKATGGVKQISELYTSKGAVQFRFDVGLNSIGEAKFGFRQSGAVATQCYDLSLSSLPLAALETELVKRIKSGQIKWDKRWVVVTGIFASKSFTALISGGRRCTAELATKLPVTGIGFNIADPNLDIGIAAGDRMEYQAVAEKGIEPFIQVHCLAFPKKGDPYLKPYG